MAVIAKFISYDGGVAFSETSLKIQKQDEEKGRIIPIADIESVGVRKPSEESEGFVLVRLLGYKSSKRNAIYFDDDQYDEALQFKHSFDAFLDESMEPVASPRSVKASTQNQKSKKKPEQNERGGMGKICPKCGTPMQAQVAAELQKRGCMTTLLYIFLLFIPVIGWIALFALLRGRKTKTVTYMVCPNCGHRVKK